MQPETRMVKIPPAAQHTAAGESPQSRPPPRGRHRALARYVFLEIPGWVAAAALLMLLVEYWELAPRTALLLFALWVAKDFALFPVLRIAYEDAPPDGTDRLLGALGTTRGRLDPEGWVLVGSELWRAELAPGQAPLERGAAVRVTAVRGLTLSVEPA